MASPTIHAAHRRPPTPFRLYLDAHPSASLGRVGERMKPYLDGDAPKPESLSQWSTGSRAPSARAQLAMEKATNGEVTPLDWVRWKAEVERLRRMKR